MAFQKLFGFKQSVPSMPSDYRASLSTGVYGGYMVNQETPVLHPYGSWTSPLTSVLIASSNINLSYLQLHQSKIYWVERRPNEQGRNVITTHDDEAKRANDDERATKDLTPKEHNCASGVHEYGGVPYILLDDGRYLACNWDDGAMYVADEKDSDAAVRVTEPSVSGKYLYCDLCQSPSQPQCVYAVREHHCNDDEPAQVVNALVCIDIVAKTQTVVASGNTFYAYPRVSPDGTRIAYITWNHPNMPWDNTMLCVARLSKNGEIAASRIADSASSIIQPKWCGDSRYLFYITDQRGRWELWRFDVESSRCAPLLHNVGEYEYGWPVWNIGKERFDFMGEDVIYAAGIKQGTSCLIKFDNVRAGKKQVKMKVIDLDADLISMIYELRCDVKHKKVFLLAGGPLCPCSIFEHHTRTDNKKKIMPSIVASSASTVDRKYISIPQARAFPTSDNGTAYAYIYQPKNDDIEFDAHHPTHNPPLLVLSHGGPTSQCDTVYNEAILFFTSRGWMVANVNYRGSTGYSTQYRQALKGQWGRYDMDDCCAIAQCLKQEGKVDPERCCIRGGSAGGYTTLCCLTMDERHTFNAGCSRYGVADLKLLLTGTHKFEAEYLYGLVGDDEDAWKLRSPIHCVQKLRCPVLFLHGDLDRVVPLNQAQVMFDALKKKKITTAMHVFKDERHGFKKAETKIAAMDFEYTFYAQVLDFSLSKQDEEKMARPHIISSTK
eukprot:CAMPEP_0202688696 /NCGR_PEP_ID=MMETSP1385-20130828/4168_1 /ASSEMBLY_ACC=CAM_ASM_000861 /TAXON_ID=933848 /ORGANISM="Elphidium margaritaceum" /LENGTH=719 /DNA_ID=CAMNT_0049343725 /DNA_START=30 /DNA_END=2189 /DNA_ORIENTATION=+